MDSVLYKKLRKKRVVLKGFLAILIVFMMGFNVIIINATKTHEDFINEANILNELGLFEGSDLGFELGRYGTRVEAAVIIVRLLGMADTATKIDYEHPYSDVPTWADPYVGYLYHEGLTKGIGEGKYGSDNYLSPNQFITFALRSLSYDDSKDDFKWNEALDKALELKIIDKGYKEYLYKDTKIYRDDIVAIMYNLLNQKMNEQETSLIDFLISRKMTTLDKAMELGIYKQEQIVTITGVVLSINQTQKAVITETINDYDYYVLVPFGDSEDSFTGVINIQTEIYKYECVLTKEAYLSSTNLQNLSAGQRVILTGKYVTNVLESDSNTRYIIIN